MINFENGITPLSQETFNKLQIDLLKTVFPIGSTYITQNNTNPNEILKFGTWERLKGKVCLGLDEDDANMNTIGNTGGEKEHILTVDEMPSHSHYQRLEWDDTVGWGPINASSGANANINDGHETGETGGSQPHNNLQPYEVVGYMWIRRG